MSLTEVIRYQTGVIGQILLRYDSGQYEIIHWPDPGVDQPTTEQINQWAATPPPDAATAAAWGAIRAERDALLAACDWRVLPDAPGDTAPWLAYRQALRDLPQTFSDPAAIVWPTPPPN